MSHRRKTLAIFDQLEREALGDHARGLLREDELAVGLDDELFVQGLSGARIVCLEADSTRGGLRGAEGPSSSPPSPSPCSPPPPRTKRTTPYVAKPSRIKPPTERMNYFAPRDDGGLDGLSARPGGHEDKEQDEDSPFTRRIKELENNPELAFAGSSKLRTDTSNDVPALGATRTKKSAAERQWEQWGTDGQLF